MNFIVDGMDRCGKTTLIDRLPELMDKNEPIISTHFPKVINIEDPIEYNKKLYKLTYDTLEYYNDSGGQFIMDRSHISEYVYGKLYRGYNTDYVMDFEIEHDILIKLRNTMLIVLVDWPDGIIDRDDGKSNSIERKNLEKELAGFSYAFYLSKFINKMFIEIHNKTEDDVFNCIKGRIEHGI